MGNIVYDTYYYSDASKRLLLNIKYQNGSLKQEYEYDSYDHRITRIKEYDRNGNYNITSFIYSNGFLLEERYYSRNSATVYKNVVYEYEPGTGFLVGITDTDGTVTEYDNLTGGVKVTAPDGVVTDITYDADGRNVADVTTAGVTTNYRYDAYGRLKHIMQNGLTTKLDYDIRGNPSGVVVGGRRLINIGYSSNDKPIGFAYANRQTVSYSYSAKGQVTEIFADTTLIAKYEYDAHGNIQKEIDYVNQTTTLYSVNLRSDMTGVDVYATPETSGAAGNSKYVNAVGQIKTSTDSIKDVGSRQSSYNYNANGDLTSIAGQQGTYGYSYNSYGFLAGTSIGNFSNTLAYGSDDMLASYTVKYSASQIAAYSYIYDMFGRIREIKENNVLKISYEYDALGRLRRENNAYTGKTSQYTYDDGGNILSIDIYSYTMAVSLAQASKTREITYGYTGGFWKDQATSYTVKDVIGGSLVLNAAESYNISYDLLGNPTSYKGNTLTWTMGRRLASYGVGTAYKYNAEGYRTQKTVNGTVTKYYLDEGRIFAESTGGAYTWYYYGALGLQGFERGGAQYYYILDAQANITGVANSAGTVIARYAYDAWGKVTVYDGSWNVDTNAESIGNKNPFRYRGYYYDSDTGLYYLQSRYYDPSSGRFLNIDDPFMTLEGVYNLYAYCYNDPVNYSDPSGFDAVSAFMSVLFALGKLASSPLVTAAIGIFDNTMSAIMDFYGKYKHFITAIGLTATAVSAIGTAISIIATCNPGAWIALAVTLCVGAGMLLNFAAAEVQEGLGYGNFLRDSFIFKGNQQAYDITMLVTEVAVSVGTIIGQTALANGLIGQCFVACTAVLTSSGATEIENIEVGDLVYAYDDQSGDIALKEVVRLFRNETYELTTVKTNDGQEIISTPSHPYFTIERGWILAKDLRAGDTLLYVNGKTVIVEWVQHEIFENPVTVYNFEVRDYHTYFVAESVNVAASKFVLVHNSCTPPRPDKITGYSKHALDHAISRHGHGVSPAAILDTFKNPQKVLYDSTRDAFTYISKSAKVIVNPNGKIVTVMAKSSKFWRYP